MVDSIISVDFCRTSYQHSAMLGATDLAGYCFATGADGTVVAIYPSSDVLKPLAETRLESVAEQEVEQQLYLRNFDQATGRVLRLAHECLAGGDADKAERLMRLLEPQPVLTSGHRTPTRFSVVRCVALTVVAAYRYWRKFQSGHQKRLLRNSRTVRRPICSASQAGPG